MTLSIYMGPIIGPIFLGMRSWDHVLDSTPPSPMLVPGGAVPPPIIKYISLYATYLHSIHPGKLCPIGPSPWGQRHLLFPLPTPGCLPWVGSGTKCELTGPQVTLPQGESAAIRPNTRKETHAILTTHTRREAAPASLRP